MAAPELDCLAGMGKIIWRTENDFLPDHSLCPSHRIIRPDKIWMVRDWSSPGYVLNGVLSKPGVDYRRNDGFLALLGPAAHVVRLDLQDTFLRRLVPRAPRRPLRVRHPVAGRFEVFMFLPFRLGPSSAWNDCSVEEQPRWRK